MANFEKSETPTRPSTRLLLPPSPNSPDTFHADCHHAYLYPPVLTPPSQSCQWEDHERPSKRRRTNDVSGEDVFTAIEQLPDIGDLSWLEREEEPIGGPAVNIQAASPDRLIEETLVFDASDEQPNGPKSYEDQALDSILVDANDQPTDAVAFPSGEFCASESSNDEICFGMVGPIPLALNPHCPPAMPHTFVKIHVLDGVRINFKDGSLFLLHDLSTVGQLSPRIAGILRELQKDLRISIQIRCTVTRVDSQRPKSKTEGLFSELRATLSAIVYGPFLLFDKVGDFFEENDICLQDLPGGCDRNVRYRNPHKLSGLDEDAPMTIDRDLTGHCENWPHQESVASYLDDLNFPQDLPEANMPAALRTLPHKHQLQGLYFMQTRERGWCIDRGLKDIWKTTQICGVPMYWNTISDDVQQELPEEFRGGLLFDDMGLGKTLTTISLIASDLESSRLTGAAATLGSFATWPNTRCTLVIVPPPLLHMWEDQLATHLQPGRIRWCKHHSSHRLSQLVQIAEYDVILTTYNIVATESKMCRGSTSILFQARWHRIILDEAQEIRDPRTQTAKAVCALKADRRWAITGTPIQNHLTDFRALLQFLKVHPYDDPAVFAKDITSIWQTDSDTAIRRLMRLITCLGLRRSKKCLELPDRVHQDIFLPFSPVELELYEPLEAHVMNVLNQVNPTDRSVQHNVLKGLNALRLICNFGTLSDVKHLKVYASSNEDWSKTEAQVLFDSLVTTGDTTCCRCSIGIASVQEPGVGWSDAPDFDVLQREPAISECARYLCGSCNLEAQRGEGLYSGWCGHDPPCAAQTIKASSPSTHLNTTPIDQLNLWDCPTKIRALIGDLTVHSTAKSVVFSAWRTTLDLCARALTLASISYVRFDGQVSEPNRADALARFRSHPEIKVILFTISCGAVGLDLTAANRAYLMEPQWNPTVEDQAFARIHRMGQKRPVTTIRFLMKDSYEEEVTNVQKQKRNFADLLLSGKKSKGFRGGYSEMSMAYETVKRLVGRR